MDVKTTFRNLVRDQSVSICMLHKASGFLNILLVITLNIVFLVVKVLFSFVLRYFCKRCVFIHLLHLFLALFTFGVLGP